MTGENKKPTHAAYVVRDREDKPANWREIGIGYEHEDGKGLTLLLDAVPVEGKITVRRIEPKAD